MNKTEGAANPEAMRQFVAALQFAQVVRVYSGKAGCGCGCKGKYTSTTANPAPGDDKVNDAVAKQMFNRVVKAAPEALVYQEFGDTKCIAFETESRYTWVYLA